MIDTASSKKNNQQELFDFSHSLSLFFTLESQNKKQQKQDEGIQMKN